MKQLKKSWKCILEHSQHLPDSAGHTYGPNESLTGETLY